MAEAETLPDSRFVNGAEVCQATFVRHIEIHDTLGSTNDRAAELAKNTKIALPTLIIARQQTAGRGRGQHKWLASEGALTFSLLLEPTALGIGTPCWPQLSLATAAAVCDAIASELKHGRQRAGASPPSPENSSHLAIKWPNDIMLDDRKVCGILIESPGGASPSKDRLIIGIGINVNNSFQDVPTDLTMARTSLCEESGGQHDIQGLLISVLRALAVRFRQITSNDPQLQFDLSRYCWLTQKAVVVHADAKPSLEGICVGISPKGALLIENASGVQSVYSGTVRLL
jgi:BirA family transcriptional regulator, biotin operon repressor / biotin---[acetyl-CoA-carboxylase] ligase